MPYCDADRIEYRFCSHPFPFVSTGKYRLLVLPDNARLAARTNAILAGVLRGECGCRAMGRQDQVTDGFTAECQQAYHQLIHKPDFEWYGTVDFSTM